MTDKESFNTCSSCEEQLLESDRDKVAFRFNTCSSCEEQREHYTFVSLPIRFNTCSSCEEQPRLKTHLQSLKEFQYMLLLRGATKFFRESFVELTVSIHAPLARSNGADLRTSDLSGSFQYMLLLRGATPPLNDDVHSGDVSIHAPLARSNYTAPVSHDG